ncbi:MAG: S-layer homology domain-containing protein, partial [Veillonella sp.]|nr:S-layer homology domain-containing protein [Veillonella sp.]
EYDVIDKNFRTAYAASEPKATIFATFPDVANNRLYAVVSDISKATQASISKAFGDKVAMAIK